MLQVNQQKVETSHVNKLLVPEVENVLDQMKIEIAEEMGIALGADTTARENGKVGAEMTKRLVELGKQQLMKNNGVLH